MKWKYSKMPHSTTLFLGAWLIFCIQFEFEGMDKLLHGICMLFLDIYERVDVSDISDQANDLFIWCEDFGCTVYVYRSAEEADKQCSDLSS